MTGKIRHNKPSLIKICGVTEMPQPSNHIPELKEHAYWVQTPVKITSSSPLYICCGENEMHNRDSCINCSICQNNRNITILNS